jgi:peptidoglycan-associated lipoprotein
MKSISRNLCFALFSAVLVLTGCTKKPQPTPADTAVAPTGPSALNPVPVSTGEPIAPGTNLEPRPPGYYEDADKITGLLPPVYFDFDQSAIKQGERDKINAAVDYIKKTPQYRMMLEGHCDWRGTAEYNLGLGDRRAQAVKQFIQKLGIPADKLETLSKGSLGAAEKGTEDQMSKDRRVEFVVLKK